MKKFTFSLILGISSLYSSSLIVYNSNIGLVHEERPFTLQRDEKSIIYKDVASSIITDSINLKLPKEVQLYSQQYRYDKLNLSKLLEYNIGKKVKIAGQEYTLLSANSKQVIVKNTKNKIVVKKSSDVVFDKIVKHTGELEEKEILFLKDEIVRFIISFDVITNRIEIESHDMEFFLREVQL